MKPINFPQANRTFYPPPDLDESQVRPIGAWVGLAQKGSMDGSGMVVVAWAPDDEERIRISNGGAIFLTCEGGLPPHFLSTSFEEATKPA